MERTVGEDGEQLNEGFTQGKKAERVHGAGRRGRWEGRDGKVVWGSWGR